MAEFCGSDHSNCYFFQTLCFDFSR